MTREYRITGEDKIKKLPGGKEIYESFAKNLEIYSPEITATDVIYAFKISDFLPEIFLANDDDSFYEKKLKSERFEKFKAVLNACLFSDYDPSEIAEFIKTLEMFYPEIEIFNIQNTSKIIEIIGDVLIGSFAAQAILKFISKSREINSFRMEEVIKRFTSYTRNYIFTYIGGKKGICKRISLTDLKRCADRIECIIGAFFLCSYGEVINDEVRRSEEEIFENTYRRTSLLFQSFFENNLYDHILNVFAFEKIPISECITRKIDIKDHNFEDFFSILRSKPFEVDRETIEKIDLHISEEPDFFTIDKNRVSVEGFRVLINKTLPKLVIFRNLLLRPIDGISDYSKFFGCPRNEDPLSLESISSEYYIREIFEKDIQIFCLLGGYYNLCGNEKEWVVLDCDRYLSLFFGLLAVQDRELISAVNVLTKFSFVFEKIFKFKPIVRATQIVKRKRALSFREEYRL